MNKNLVKAYEVDASGIRGKALDVVTPRSIAELRGVVANARRIVPRGGGTGLVGGAVPQKGKDVVVEMLKLNRISALDIGRATVEAEAGVVLDDLQNYLEKYGLEFPVNPLSHEVATIGGMIATDAVGSRAVKYGKTSNWVRWVEVVNGRGEIERKGATELSDYAGMEGITGVIVKACLKLVPLKKRTVSLFKIESVSEVISAVKNLKMNPNVSMIEFLDKVISRGIGLEENYHLIVEYEDGSGKLRGDDYKNLLAVRDKVYPYLAGEGYGRIEDPKILVDKFDKLLPWLESKGIPVFGHLGAGILHPCFNKDTKKFIPELMKFVRQHGGVVSGEHGIGLLKKEFVEANDKKILVNVKKRTDPENKFNAGKVL